MVTGDNLQTAIAIARRANILDESIHYTTGNSGQKELLPLRAETEKLRAAQAAAAGRTGGGRRLRPRLKPRKAAPPKAASRWCPTWASTAPSALPPGWPLFWPRTWSAMGPPPVPAVRWRRTLPTTAVRRRRRFLPFPSFATMFGPMRRGLSASLRNPAWTRSASPAGSPVRSAPNGAGKEGAVVAPADGARDRTRDGGEGGRRRRKLPGHHSLRTAHATADAGVSEASGGSARASRP